MYDLLDSDIGVYYIQCYKPGLSFLNFPSFYSFMRASNRIEWNLEGVTPGFHNQKLLLVSPNCSMVIW
jgi:hypothetical protein